MRDSGLRNWDSGQIIIHLQLTVPNQQVIMHYLKPEAWSYAIIHI